MLISFNCLLAEDVLTSKIYAVKIEHARSPHPQLEYEAKVYKYLAGIRTLLFLFIPFLIVFS